MFNLHISNNCNLPNIITRFSRKTSRLRAERACPRMSQSVNPQSMIYGKIAARRPQWRHRKHRF